MGLLLGILVQLNLHVNGNREVELTEQIRFQFTYMTIQMQIWQSFRASEGILARTCN